MIKWSRRQLFGTAGAAVAMGAFAPSATARPRPSRVELRNDIRDGNWLGPAYWSNRIEDWRREGDWITCTNGRKSYEGRTAFVLTREIGTSGSGTLECDITLAKYHENGGFGGFLIGIGSGKLHHLSASLAQRGSGEAGGIMAVIEATGTPVFREHTDDKNPINYATLEADYTGSGAIDLASGPAKLTLQITQVGAGINQLRLTATQGSSKQIATLDGVPDHLLAGGIALISSPPKNLEGTTFKFKELATSGTRVAIHEDRAVGACAGCLYSIANGVLNLSAQFQAIGPSSPQSATLEIRRPGDRWKRAAKAEIGDGWAAIFRVEGWDASRAGEYRVWWGKEAVFAGELRRDPVHEDRPVVISMQSCVLSTQQALESDPIGFAVPEEERYGRYSPLNFNHPHADLVTNSLAHDPDLIFVSGDQYYEHNPTRRGEGEDDLKLDTLYRWLQWCIAFAPLVKDRPSVVLVDDHDVLQGNLWGNGGRDAPEGDEVLGGYTKGSDLVRMVYRMQCGGNPEAAEPAPITNGIPVSYCSFEWGGAEFAIIEDRKWKTSPIQGEGLLGHIGELLGERQEQFLERWAATPSDKPRIILTQSVWAGLETEPTGEPVMNFDANGYPALGRRKAVQLAKQAGALLLSGDQHLTSIVRHGIDRHDDGPVQFTSPSGGTFWQRWFEPSAEQPNPRGALPYTGDWRDAFGNPLRVLAVANPAISYADYRKHVKGRSQILYDRKLKREGYGVVRVDHAAASYAIECWEWNKNPITEPESQFPGWPFVLPFSEV